MNQTHEVIYCKRTKNRMMSQDVTLKRTHCSRKNLFFHVIAVMLTFTIQFRHNLFCEPSEPGLNVSSSFFVLLFGSNKPREPNHKCEQV